MSDIEEGGCDVCLGSEPDGDYAEFYEAKIIKARKQHKCCECDLDIKPGQRYEVVSGLFDGEFFRQKTCLICCELRTAFSCNGQLIQHTMLWEEITEYLFPRMTTGCLQKIRTAEAKQFLIDRWNEWKFERTKCS